MQINRYKIRCEVDLARRTIREVVTGSVPTLPAGSSLRFELGFFYRDVMIDIAAWDSLKIDVVDAANITGTRLMSKVIGREAAEGAPSGERLDSSPDKAAWNAGTKQHALITFSDDESMYVNPSANEAKRKLWIILRATPSNAAPFSVAFDHALAAKDGHTGTGAPEPNDPAYYTASDVDALFQRKNAVTNEFQAVKVWNPDQGKFQFIGIRGLEGEEHIAYVNEI